MSSAAKHFWQSNATCTWCNLTVLPLYLNRHEYSEASEKGGGNWYPQQSLTSSLVDEHVCMSKLMILNRLSWCKMTLLLLSIHLYTRTVPRTCPCTACSFFTWNYAAMICHQFHGTGVRWNGGSSMNSTSRALRGGVQLSWLGVSCLSSRSEISWPVCVIRLLYCLPAVWFASTTTCMAQISEPWYCLLWCLFHFVVMCHGHWRSWLCLLQCCTAVTFWLQEFFLVASSSVIPLHLSLRPMLRAVVLKCWCRKRSWVTYAWTLLLLFFKRPLVVCAS
jgi:hypothetical protein